MKTNPSSYDKLNFLLHIEHQRFHYKRILQAKKYIDFKFLTQAQQKNSKNYPTCSTKGNKYENLLERERKENNYKLVNRIHEINCGEGLLAAVEAKGDGEGKGKRRTSYVGGCGLASNRGRNKNEEQGHRIVKENHRFAERLQEVKPAVGTVSEWKSHFKQYKSIERRIQKNRSYDPETQLRKTLSSLSKQKTRQTHIFSDLANTTKKQRTKTTASQDQSQKELKLKELQQKIVIVRKHHSKKRNVSKKIRGNKCMVDSSNNKKDTEDIFCLSRGEEELFKIEANRIIRSGMDQY